MNIIGNEIEGVTTLDFQKYTDSRGVFSELFKENNYRDSLGDYDFVQDNLSVSQSRVLRGLHYQIKRPQGHLITLLGGEIMDVGVDLRKNSKTYGNWIGIYLKHTDNKQIFLPPGVAHGFIVLSSNDAIIHYKCTDYYYAGDEGGLNWADQEISIKWPITKPILNERDNNLPCLVDITDNNFPKIEI